MRYFFICLVAIVCTVVAASMWFLKRQTISYRDLQDKFSEAQLVRFDDQGIPTVQAADWLQLIELQGYVIASERMWQMDTMRRQAGGRLSEWFGPAATDSDRAKVLEGWTDVATEAVNLLPADQRAFCNAYAQGINRFIADNAGKWGAEYALLRVAAEPWECRDSILILMSMADTLTTTSFREAQQWVWRRNLPKDWEAFLFPHSHPWNQPLFDAKLVKPMVLPHEQHFIPMAPIAASEWAGFEDHERHMIYGSNSWAWRGPGGYFLANDPHLGYQVPQLWYAMRLRVSSNDWVVGAALPGVPGITLGMNPYIAWAFTNIGEDVDDLLLEEVNEDATQYVAAIIGGKKDWRPVQIEKKALKIKGAEDLILDVRHTHRGPLLKRSDLGDVWASRQWLPLKAGAVRAGTLGIPTLAIDRAKNWQEANTSLDQMLVPGQNVLVMDRSGGMGYRASGTGVMRKVSGRWPQPAHAGEWIGYEPTAKRRRMWLAPKSEYSNGEQIATANERIWVDDTSHNWATDDRKDRIRSVLNELGNGSVTAMQDLQQDDHSRFLKELLTWLAVNIRKHNMAGGFDFEAWQNWTGSAAQAPDTFADGLAAESFMLRVMERRVRAAFLAKESQSVPNYYFSMQRAWLIKTMQEKDGLRAFGIDEADMTQALVAAIKKSRIDRIPYYEKNRWLKQHPFVGRVPVIGYLFRVREIDQFGFEDLVKIERPNSGASMRLVWDMSNPIQSTWSFPVGQSGHVGSKFYRSLQLDWQAKRYVPVFSNDFVWDYGSK